jgi:hypothetical protein
VQQVKATLPAGAATDRHYHKLSEEFYYLLEGRGLMEIAGEECEVGTGYAILRELGHAIAHPLPALTPLRLEAGAHTELGGIATPVRLELRVDGRVESTAEDAMLWTHTGVSGPAFRKVSYPDDTRRGVLGHASILTLTSHGNRTSPVLRGKWVLEVLLGSPPPPPPPNVPDLEKTGDAVDGRMLSVAEQLAPLSREEQDVAIAQIDDAVAIFANVVRKPGFFLGSITRVVRLGEHGSVPAKIDILR